MTKKKFDISDSKRTSFFIGTFFFGMASLVYLYPDVMFSIRNTIILTLFLIIADFLVIKFKTNIENGQTIAGTCFASVIIQLSLFFWINYIPIDHHVEKHKIVGKSKFDDISLIKLENNAYDEFIIIRMQNKYDEKYDTVSLYFKDGLLGLKVIDSVR
jgi:hypothetical protein